MYALSLKYLKGTSKKNIGQFYKTLMSRKLAIIGNVLINNQEGGGGVV